MYDRWHKGYSSVSDEKRAMIDSDDGYASYMLTKTFKIDPLLETAFSEWRRFRASYPNKAIDNFDLISIRDLYGVKLSPLDVSAMLLFDRSYFQSLNHD